MHNQPVFSVILTCYNRIRYIEKCVDAILRQTFSDFELIIIDDCSSDGTYEMLYSFKDERISIYKTQFQSGSPSTPRNIGLKFAKGKYLAFCDSDDFYNLNHLENALNLINTFSLSKFILGFNANVVDKDGERGTYFDINNSIYFRKISFFNMFSSNKIIHSSLILSNEEIYCFRNYRGPNEDYLFLLDNMAIKDVYYCNIPDVNYYFKSSNSTSKNNSRIILFKYKYYYFSFPIKFLYTYPYFIMRDFIKILLK